MSGSQRAAATPPHSVLAAAPAECVRGASPCSGPSRCGAISVALDSQGGAGWQAGCVAHRHVRRLAVGLGGQSQLVVSRQSSSVQVSGAARWGCRKSWRAQQAATGAGTACPGCCCCCISACTSDWNSLRMQRTNALKLPPPLSCSKSRCSPGTAGSHACTATAAGACQRQVEHKGSWDGSCTEQVHTWSKQCHNHSSHSKVARRHCPSMQPVVHTCPAKSSLLTCIRVVAHHLHRKLEGAGVVPRVQLRIKSGDQRGRRYTV